MSKNYERVMLVGPRTTPDLVSGMRIGFELLVASFEERELPHVVVNRSRGMSDKTVGTLTFRSVLANLYLFAFYCIQLFRVNSVYITIGTSRFGFVRDALMIWPAWLFGKRVILHLKGGGYLDFYQRSSGLLQLLMRQTFARVDVIIVLGELLVDQFAFVPNISKKLKVVPNGLPKGLETETFDPKSLEEAPTIRLLYLSNMIPTKGYLDLVHACAILRERDIPVKCDFCGALVRTVNDEGVEYGLEHFQGLIESLGLEEVVEYHGTVSGVTKEDFLRRAHLFVLPTYYPWEGQPISIIEALAFGTPVISTRYRGIPEEVIHEYNGFLVSPQSPTQIADAVEALWKDPAKYERFSRHALAHFGDNFTQEAHLDRLLPIVLGSDGDGCGVRAGHS